MTRFKELAEEKRTIVFYESPYRLVKTLTQITEYVGTAREVAVCREISKVIKHFTTTPPKVEIVVVLAGVQSK